MFEYVIKFNDGSVSILSGYEINIPKSYKQGFVEYGSGERTFYYSIHAIEKIIKKRVDRDV